MARGPWALRCSLASALALWSPVALAQSSAPATGDFDRDRAAAQVLFDEAVTLRESGRLNQACAKFAESLRLDPGIGTRFNLADCYVRTGKVASAWTHFLEVAAATEMAGQPERAEVARRRAKELEPRLSHMRIEPSDPADGLVIRRNGVVVGRAQWDTAVPVDPGRYEIVAEAPGYLRWSRYIELVGDRQSVTVEVPELEEAPEPEPGQLGAATDSGLDGMGIAGVVLGGLGLVGLGVGTGFGVVAMQKKSEVDDICPDLERCSADGIEANNQGKTAGNVSTAGFAAGGALAGTGLVLLAVSLSRSGGQEQARWVLPLVAPFGAGVSAGTRF